MSDSTRADRPFAPVGRPTVWLRTVVIAGVIASVVIITLQFPLRGSAQDLVDGVITVDQFEDDLGLFTIVSLLTSLLFVAQIAITCVWTWRLARNMQGGLARAPQSVSQPGVTVAANIIGFCTLYILNVFMWREIWKGSDPDVAPGDPAWKQSAVDRIVYVWFALAFGGAALGFGAGIGQSTTGSIGPFGEQQAGEGSRQLAEDLTERFGVTLATSLVGIAAGIAFVVLVDRLARRHMRATGEAVA